MTKKEETPKYKIKQGFGTFATLPSLNYDDILHIAEHDAAFRTLLAAPRPQIEVKYVEVEKRVEVPVPYEVVKYVDREVLPEGWARYLKLLSFIEQEEDLASILLGRGEMPALIRFIARAADWETLQSLVNLFNDRCKAKQRPMDDLEKALLETCLDIYNVRWPNNEGATLVFPTIGEAYDYRHHLRPAGDSGSHIQAVYVPALINAGGNQVKPALVVTH